MTPEMQQAILDGQIEDELGLRWLSMGWDACWYGGTALLWIAAFLTLITGIDYLRKAMPHLREA
jgi:CDP-diacylglycerol--glycerol-3-phosphate 3-phosphatidyltransferase